MLFNSIDFAFFLPIVFFIYWFFKGNKKNQNIVLLIASYYFYGSWNIHFLLLIIFSTLVDYLIGIKLQSTTTKHNKKLYLWLSLTVNLGLLFTFKYFNFFIDSFNGLITFFGHPISSRGLNIILPVGISFYTFQTLSYTIDIYKKKITPIKDFIAFSAFVSFFPQLVAGPIERASNLLPQFTKNRKFNHTTAIDGLNQILWGLFKKVVIADNCAIYANEIFDNYQDYSGSILFLGLLYFSFQIYCDFSGYSDIAIGTARLFGFNLMKNFNLPYFSKNITEFWRRWHISLSTWFRDYLYIPLGGGRGNKLIQIRNVFIIFIVSGFWHGANFTFIIWGTLHAIWFLPSLLLKNKTKILDYLPQPLKGIKNILSTIITFTFVTFAWVFFRAENTTIAFGYLNKMLTSNLFSVPTQFIKYLPLIFVLVLIEWFQRNKEHGMELTNLKYPFKLIIYIGIINMLIYLGNYNETEFIYFQF